MNERGYTLLEMMAVIAIILVGGVAVVAGVASVRKASLTTSAARVAAAVRYLYDLSVLNNRPYRLVVDLEGRSFRGEPVGEACGGALLPSEEEQKFGAVPAAGTVATGAAGVGPTVPAGEGGGEGSEGAPESPRRRIGAKENLLTRQTLPEGISFGAVVTTHHDEPVEEGEAEVFFFPDGYVEKALIYLKKGEETYTVETVPLKGVGVVHSEELDPRVAMEGR